MTDYYVDLDNPAAWSTRTGLDHTGNEWLGLSGLQKAADTVTAGNTINIKGTVICTNLKNITYDNLSGTFTVGEEVQVDASNKGIVSEDTGTILTVEVTAGVFADNNTMTGQTSGATADVNVTVAVKGNGLDVNTNAGSIPTGYIRFIGVNSSWVNDETRAKLDGNAGTVAGCNSPISRTKQYIHFENIEVDDSDSTGFNYGTGGYNGLFINCWAHHCDSRGIYSYTGDICIRCLTTHNGGEGHYCYSSYNRRINCVSHNNTGRGVYFYASSNLEVGCIEAENTSHGIQLYNSHNIILFNVIDENLDGIAVLQGTNNLCLFNRITNQSDDGIVATAGELVYEDWNLFYGNTGTDRDDTGATGLIEQGGNSKTDSAGDGYTDQAGHDFNLTDSADYRREAITLPKWDGASP